VDQNLVKNVHDEEAENQREESPQHRFMASSHFRVLKRFEKKQLLFNVT
jgi:hypothetical protein